MFVLSTIFDDQDRPEGFFVSLGFNLVSNADNAQGFTASTDQIGTFVSPLEPMLDPNGLQDNGGPTSTIALLPGSPAVDKGTSNGLTTDQRGTGFPRAFDDPSILNAIAGDGTDVGAYELQTAVPTPTPTPTLTPTPTPTPTPAPPVAKRAANVTAKSFVANWSVVVGVKGYRLDISTDDSFKTYLAGYQDLDVGNVTGWSVTGLSPLTDYYYRVRAYDATSTSPNSNVIKVKTRLK